MGEISFWHHMSKISSTKKGKFWGWLKMAQFLLTEFLGLPTLPSIISDISSTILQILVPILLQISWIFQNTPNIYNLMVLKGVMDKKQKNQTSENIYLFIYLFICKFSKGYWLWGATRPLYRGNYIFIHLYIDIFLFI